MGGTCDNKEGDLNRERPFPVQFRDRREGMALRRVMLQRLQV